MNGFSGFHMCFKSKFGVELDLELITVFRLRDDCEWFVACGLCKILFEQIITTPSIKEKLAFDSRC